MSDMRTPLSRVRGHGSAKSGTDHFWLQRLTALANVPLVIFLMASVVALVGADYETVKAYLSMPIVSILFLLLIGSGIYHMRLGMQVIIEDYVHGEGKKLLAVIGNNFFSVLVGLACVYAVLKLGLGG
ncbi:MAG: succinate dehydrogenase, hydrophobic membrane anchor protein [Rhodobiaceae bacterium]|nr:succinate dehydrogenase, hydrophobic membrane anchor protein [Rhodobiaceae bacterium]